MTLRGIIVFEGLRGCKVADFSSSVRYCWKIVDVKKLGRNFALSAATTTLNAASKQSELTKLDPLQIFSSILHLKISKNLLNIVRHFPVVSSILKQSNAAHVSKISSWKTSNHERFTKLYSKLLLGKFWPIENDLLEFGPGKTHFKADWSSVLNHNF